MCNICVQHPTRFQSEGPSMTARKRMLSMEYELFRCPRISSGTKYTTVSSDSWSWEQKYMQRWGQRCPYSPLPDRTKGWETGVRLVRGSLKPLLLRKSSKPAVVCLCPKGDLLQEGWWYCSGVNPPPSLWVCSMEAKALCLMECCAWECPGPQLQWEPH